MDDLKIEKTQGTPEVNFNAKTGVLQISGRANANDISLFYKGLEAWLDKYLADPAETTTLELQLEYINSVFSKLLFTFIEKCKVLYKKNKKIVVKWYHFPEDEDSIDDANKYSKIIDLPFEIIERE